MPLCRTASCVKRAEFVEENVGRPAIANDMVTGEDESVQLRVETGKTQAHYWAINEIEGRRSFLFLGVFESDRSLRRRDGRQDLERHRQLGCMREMKRIALRNNRCTQSFMAVDDVLQGDPEKLCGKFPAPEENEWLR